MSRFSPTVIAENRSADLIGNAISEALGAYSQGKRQKKADARGEEDRARSMALQDYGLAKEGLHLQKPGELPPQFDVNVSGGVSPEDMLTQSIRGALAPSESGRGVPLAAPLTASTSRDLSFGNGYYVDHGEQAANAKRSSEAQFNTILSGALAKAKGEDLAHPGKADADKAYTEALTQQALGQAKKANEPTYHPTQHIDPLSPEGLDAQRKLKAFEAGLKPAKPATGIAALPPAQATQVRIQQGALLNMRKAITALQDAVKGGGMALRPGEYQAKIRALQANAQIQFKEAANLGALSGPDMGLVESALGSATNPMQLLRGGAGGVASSLDAAQQSLDARARTMEQVYSTPMPAGFYAPPTPAAPPAPALAPSTRKPLGLGQPKGNVDLRGDTGGTTIPLSPHVQTIDEMIRAGKSDAEIKAAIARGVH